MNEVRQKSCVWINLVQQFLFGATKAISSTVSVELLSNLTRTRHTVPRLSQITIVVVGRNNLTVFKTTSIGSVLVKGSRPPTNSRLARPGSRVPSLMWWYWVKKKISCSLLFSEQPILGFKNFIMTGNGYVSKILLFLFCFQKSSQVRVVGVTCAACVFPCLEKLKFQVCWVANYIRVLLILRRERLIVNTAHAYISITLAG